MLRARARTTCPKLLAPLLLASLFSARIADADYLRCGGAIVSTGDLKPEVLSRCGEPVAREAHEKEREITAFSRERDRWERVRVTVTIEEWTYNFGPGGFLYLVTFEDGKVVDIRTAGRGF